MDCIFCKIANKEIPSTIVYEDEDVMAFNDLNPEAPVHILVIPKKHIESLNAASEEDQRLLGKIMLTIAKIAAEQGIVIAASYWGKFKTTFQMIAVILMIVDLPVLHILTVACTWIALVLTVVSLVDYIAKNHKVLTEGAI